MAAELYKPFIIRKLIEQGIVKTVKSAKKIIDERTCRLGYFRKCHQRTSSSFESLTHCTDLGFKLSNQS